MMSQTNPMAMGGGQITQNVVTSASQQMQQQVSLGQQGAGGAGAANNQPSPAQMSGLQVNVIVFLKFSDYRYCIWTPTLHLSSLVSHCCCQHNMLYE